MDSRPGLDTEVDGFELRRARRDFGNARRPGETVAEFYERRDRERAATLKLYEETDRDND